MARYLVVIDETLGGRELADELRDRASGGAEIHVVVPATGGDDEHQAATGAIGGGTSSTQPAADPGVDQTAPDAARGRAFERMKQAVARFEELGAEVDGEVGDPDPRTAVGDAVAAGGPYDEILVATPPAGISKWVGTDLASELERDHDVPVTHIEAPPTGSTA